MQKLNNFSDIKYKIEDKPYGIYFKVFQNNIIVGQLIGEYVLDSEHLFVSGLYVSENYRRKGIATKLNLELLKRNQGCTLLCTINKDNNIMKKLLVKLGWQKGFSIGNKIYMIYKKGN